ncbi:type 2 isopentenyl-diphosphate Delta-isomerase [Candidatus Micrarchaeota archaeon]|nr:type 2 isopentenyl-diphosphate Delta-isomerase [Candidatus Micrarchaeota archaeon]MBU1166731.1 type 2 isopentenyl-diphosphate Delta-isomerase [Candidatus Micrarchaeota archaeon]MBU1886694.1 type 2 isopentenyl-diphosphate Delta-isomerase [Candidatus Micrarchaeota archaeon]
MKKIESRKKDHIDLVLKKGAQYSKSTGLDHVDFVHNALPEMSLEAVNLSTTFFGKSLKFPVIVTAMTGGYKDAKAINRKLAACAQKCGFGLGLGSQRAMIENPTLTSTYVVRDAAPDVPIISNIGAFQLKRYSIDQLESLVSSVKADGLAIHLNPLQEIVQMEGDTDFSGILDAISKVCASLSVPVIVKETGAGLNQEVAIKLKDAGVKYLDVAGAGGTSWSKVEYMRSTAIPGFEEWGIPTMDSIIQCRGILPLVASGGIRTGIDGAKSIALGADMCGAAYPFIKAIKAGNLDTFAETFQKQMAICAYLTGSKTLSDLKKAKLFIH